MADITRSTPIESGAYDLDYIPLCRALDFLSTSFRRPISEPLAADAEQRCLGAGQIVYAESNAIVIAEVKLGKATV